MKIRLGITLKIISIVVLVTTISFFFLTYLYIQRESKILTDNYLSKAVYLANILDAGITNYNDLKDEEKLQSYIYGLIWRDPDIIKLSINLPSKEGLETTASNDVNAVGNPANSKNQLALDEDITISELTSEEYSQALVVYTPIHIAGQVVGTYEILLSMSSVTKEMNDQIGGFALMGIYFLFAIIFVTIYLLRGVIIKPINSLSKGVEIIRDGNLNYKVPVYADDEIGNVASIFNNTVKELRGARDKIERHSEELEKQVNLRTKELNKRVEELTSTKTAMLNIMEDLDEANIKLLNSQEELKKNLGEIKKLDVEKNRFVSITAHELKTPMTAIHGFAQLLEKENVIKNPEIRNKYLKIIEDESKRLSKLVTEVLDLSRADLDTLMLTIEDVNLNILLKEVKEEMINKARNTNIYLIFKISENLPKISTDKEKLKEILINLIDNAIKYTPAGYVKVEAFQEDNHIKFIVFDTGIGIPKKYFKSIFQRFFQVESPYVRKVGGTGLGLSICKEFVEALGGKIWFKSKVGKGTIFYFTLPLKSKNLQI